MARENNYSKNFDIPGKRPPQAIEAEQSLLGGLMLDKAAIAKVADVLIPRDFYKDLHQRIYETMLELFEKSEPIDILTVANRLAEKKLLETVGGNAYLTELVNSVPTAAHVAEYANIVRHKRILRDLIDASYDIGALGYDEAEDIDVILDKAENRVFNITQYSLTQDFTPVKSTLDQAFERLDNLSKHRGTRGVATGFAGLDNKLSGLQKSDLILLAARPSVGKSALALNIAANVAIKEHVPVGIFSLEMSKDQLVDRFIAREAMLDLWRLRTGRLENEHFLAIQNALGILSEAPIFIDDTASINVLQMRAMARRLQARYGLGLIIVDYLQLVEPRTTREGIVQQITEISRSLKILARELNVPVLALSQLSRAVERRESQVPVLADLRESGALEQDADVVMFIYRERDKETSRYKNETNIIIAKHRNGPVGQVELNFDDARVAFRDVEKRLEE